MPLAGRSRDPPCETRVRFGLVSHLPRQATSVASIPSARCNRARDHYPRPRPLRHFHFRLLARHLLCGWVERSANHPRMSYGASLKQPLCPDARFASSAPTPHPQVFPTPSPAHQHLLASAEALETSVALPAVPAPGECPPVFAVTPPTPLTPPTIVPLPASPCEPRAPRVAANDSHRPLSPPPVAAARGMSPLLRRRGAK